MFRGRSVAALVVHDQVDRGLAREDAAGGGPRQGGGATVVKKTGGIAEIGPVGPLAAGTSRAGRRHPIISRRKIEAVDGDDIPTAASQQARGPRGNQEGARSPAVVRVDADIDAGVVRLAGGIKLYLVGVNRLG